MSMKQRSSSFFPLLWVMVFDHTSLNIAFPILTLLFFDMESSLFAADTSHAVRSLWYGVAVAIPHLLNIVVTPILSALSDEFGRKKILLIGTFGAFVFSIVAALGILWGMLSLVLLSCVIRGAFSRTNPIGQAIVGDIAPPAKKMAYMGYLQLAISIGAFLGPVIGGYLAKPYLFEKLNFSLPFFVAAIFGGVSSILTLLIFQETHTDRKRTMTTFKEYVVTIKKILFSPLILKISILVLLSQLSWSFYYQFTPPVLKTVFGFLPHSLGLFVGLIALWLALAAGLGVRWLEQWFTIKEIVFISMYLVFVGSLMSALFCFLQLNAHWNFLIWVAAFPTAVGDVVAYSALITLYSNTVPKEEQGKVMGICFMVVALMWAFSGLTGGFLMSLYTLLPLMIAPLGILIALSLLHGEFGKGVFK